MSDAIWEKALDSVDITKTALHGLQTIGVISSSTAGKADDALAAISAIVEAIRKGFAGETSPSLVLAEIQALQRSLASNDAAADSALDHKFQGKG